MKETRIKLNDSKAKDETAVMHTSWNTVELSHFLTPAQVLISANGSSTRHREEVQSSDFEYCRIQSDDVLDHSYTETLTDTSNDPSNQTAETDRNKEGFFAGTSLVNVSKDSGFNRSGLIEEEEDEEVKNGLKSPGSRAETAADDKTSSLFSFNASETQMWSEDTTENEDPAYQVYDKSGILNDFAGYFVPSFLTYETGMRGGRRTPEPNNCNSFVPVPHNTNERPLLFSSEEPAKATIVPSKNPAPRTNPSPIPLTVKLVSATTNHIERAYSAFMSTLFPHESRRRDRKLRRSSSNIHNSKQSIRNLPHTSGSDSDVNRSKRLTKTSIVGENGLLSSVPETQNSPQSEPGSKRGNSNIRVALTSESKSASQRGGENPGVEETKKIEQNNQDIHRTASTDQTEVIQSETRKRNFTFGKTNKKKPSHDQKFVGPSKTWRTITNSQYIATTAKKKNLNLKFGLPVKSLANMNDLASQESSSLISEGNTNQRSPGDSGTSDESVSPGKTQEVLDMDLDSVDEELQSPSSRESKIKVSPPKEDIISPKAIPTTSSRVAKSYNDTQNKKSNRSSLGLLTKNHEKTRNLGSNNPVSYDKSPVRNTGVLPGPGTVTPTTIRTMHPQARSPISFINSTKAVKGEASPNPTETSRHKTTHAAKRSHPRKPSTSSTVVDVLRMNDSVHQKRSFRQKLSKPATINTNNESFDVKAKPSEANLGRKQQKGTDLKTKKATKAPVIRSPLISQVADSGFPRCKLDAKEHPNTTSVHLAGSSQNKRKTANQSRVPVQKSSSSSMDTLGRISWVSSSPELQNIDDVTDFLSTSDPELNTERAEHADIYYCTDPTSAGTIPKSSSKFREKYFGNKCYTSNIYYTNSRDKKISPLQDINSTHELEDAVFTQFSETSLVVTSPSFRCSSEESEKRKTDICNESYTTYDYKDGRKETQPQSHFGSFCVLAGGDQQQETSAYHHSPRCTTQKCDSEIGHGPSPSGQQGELRLLAKVCGDNSQRGDAGKESSRGGCIGDTDRGLYLEESCHCRHVKHFQQGPFATEGRERWRKRNAQRQELQREGQTGGHNLETTDSPYVSPETTLPYFKGPSADRMTAVSTQEFYKKRGSSTGLLHDMATMIDEHHATSVYGPGGLQTGQPGERPSTPRSEEKMDLYRDDIQLEDNTKTGINLNEGKHQEIEWLARPPVDEGFLAEKTNGCPNFETDCLIVQNNLKTENDLKTEKVLSILLEISQKTIDNRVEKISPDNMPAKVKVSPATKPPGSYCSLDFIQHQGSLKSEENTDHETTESILESQSCSVEHFVDGMSQKRCDRSDAEAVKDVVPVHVSVRDDAKFSEGKPNCKESKQLRVQIAVSANVSEDFSGASGSIGNSIKLGEQSSVSMRHSTNKTNLEKEADSVDRSSTPVKAGNSLHKSSSSNHNKQAPNSHSNDQLLETSDTTQVTPLSLLSENFLCSKDLTSKSNVVFSIFREFGSFKTEQCTFQPKVHDSRSPNNEASCVKEESCQRKAFSLESGRRGVYEVALDNSNSVRREVSEQLEISSCFDQLSGDYSPFGKFTANHRDFFRERSRQVMLDHSRMKRETNHSLSDFESRKALNLTTCEKQDNKRPKKVVTFRDTEEKERSDKCLSYTREKDHRSEKALGEREKKLDGERAWSNLKRNYQESTLRQSPLEISPKLDEKDRLHSDNTIRTKENIIRTKENTIRTHENTIRPKPRNSGRTSPTDNVYDSLCKSAKRSDEPVHTNSVQKFENESTRIISESTTSVFEARHVKQLQATDQRSDLNRTRRPDSSPPRPHASAVQPSQANVFDKNKSSAIAEPLHRRSFYKEPHIHAMVPSSNTNTSPKLNALTVGTTRDALRENSDHKISTTSAAGYVWSPTRKLRNQSGFGEHFSQQNSFGFHVSGQKSTPKPRVPSHKNSPVPSPRIESGFKNFTARPDQKKEGIVQDRNHLGFQDLTKVDRRDLNKRTESSPKYWDLTTRDGTNLRRQARDEVTSNNRLQSTSGSLDSLHQQRSSEHIDVGVRCKNSPVHDYNNLNRMQATLRNGTSHQREIFREQETSFSNFQKDRALNTMYNHRSESRQYSPESRTRAQPLEASSSRSPKVSIRPSVASSRTRTERAETAYGDAPLVESYRRAVNCSPRGDGVSEPNASRSFNFLDIYDDSLASISGRNGQNQERYRPGINTNDKTLKNRQNHRMTSKESVHNKDHHGNKTASKLYTEAAMRYSSYSFDKFPEGGFFIPEVDTKEDSRTKNMKLMYSSSEYHNGRSSDVKQKHLNGGASRKSIRNMNMRPVQRRIPLGDISRKRDGVYDLTENSDDDITFKSSQPSDQSVLISKLNSTAAQSEVATSFAERYQYQAGSSLAGVDDSLAYYKNRSAKRKTQDFDKNREKGLASRHPESQFKSKITSPQSYADGECGASHDSTQQRKPAHPRTSKVVETGQVAVTNNLWSRGDVTVGDSVRVTAQHRMNTLKRAYSQTGNKFKLLMRADSSGGLASARLLSAEHEVQTYRSGLRQAWLDTSGRSDKIPWSDKLGWPDKVGSGEGSVFTVDRRGFDQKNKLEGDNGGRISAKNQPRKNHSPKMVSEVKESRTDYHRNASSNSRYGFFSAKGAVSLSLSRSSTSV